MKIDGEILTSKHKYKSMKRIKSKKKNSNDRIKQLLGLQYPYPKIMDVSKSVNDNNNNKHMKELLLL